MPSSARKKKRSVEAACQELQVSRRLLYYWIAMFQIKCIEGLVDCCLRPYCFFFNDTATTEIYTLSLHDALPIALELPNDQMLVDLECHGYNLPRRRRAPVRSEEHTSELQSRSDLVCRLLLE